MASKKIVIIGGGFGGISAAKILGNRPEVEVILIDKTNHHLFQPLLYQVAIAGLAPSDIAIPLRSLLSRFHNISILMNEVIDINPQTQTIVLKDHTTLNYDELIVAPGVQNGYFNHPEWEAKTFGIKNLNDAVRMRNHILECLELAEQSSDREKIKSWLSFVIIGAGPTGVELAGSIAEFCQHTICDEFKNIKLEDTQITLIEKSPQILSMFSARLSQKADTQLQELNVKIIYEVGVKEITADRVELDNGQFINTHTVIWAAGIGATRLNQILPGEKDRQGRILVNPDCTISSFPNLYLIGDAAHFKTPTGLLPGVSPVAIQQGIFVGTNILKKLTQQPPISHFSYEDKGSMATIGRRRAIANLKIIEISGTPAWFAWLLVHLIFLMGFRNRFIVFFNWVWSYFTYKRGARLITKPPPP